jgi:gliding motility-associated lipoprotein GldH
MKTRLLSIVMLLLLPIFFACRNDVELVQTYNFEDARWQRFDYLHFDFLIDKPEGEYKVLALVRYTDAFQDEDLPINVVMALPSGEERIREYVLGLRDKNKKPQGILQEGVYEITALLHDGLTIGESGKMHVEIENLRSKAFTEGIVAFGIILEAR